MKSRLMQLCLFALALVCLCDDGLAFEIFALGASGVNCHGVDRDKTFTAKLQEILRADGFEATVVNGGVDGDLPAFMYRRLPAAINSNTRMVILFPGLNDPNKTSYVESVENILSYLKEHKIPTVYASAGLRQAPEEAGQTAKKYDAYYYGEWGKDIPLDHDHWQYDNIRTAGGRWVYGHMSAGGCQLVAKNMAPLVENVLREKNIH